MPFFVVFLASVENEIIQSVSLVALSTKSLYLKIAYYLVVILTIITGIFTLALQNCRRSFWLKTKTKISLFIGIACVLLFIISSQPYPAVFTFVLLTVIFILLFIAFMVIGRIVSGVHWITDIIGGTLFSTGIVLVYILISNTISKKNDE